MKDEALTIFRRRKIGFVFQNYNLVPVLNVYENIVLPVQLDGESPDEKYIDEIVTTLGLETKLNNLPNNPFRRTAAKGRDRKGTGLQSPP